MEMAEIFDKLQAVADRYDELNELISDPEVIADSQRFMKLSKEEGSLRETVEKYNEYKKVTQTISDDEELLRESDDPDLTELTKDELISIMENDQSVELYYSKMVCMKIRNTILKIIVLNTDDILAKILITLYYILKTETIPEGSNSINLYK